VAGPPFSRSIPTTLLVAASVCPAGSRRLPLDERSLSRASARSDRFRRPGRRPFREKPHAENGSAAIGSGPGFEADQDLRLARRQRLGDHIVHGEEFARALAVETLGSHGRAVDLDVEVLVEFLAPIGCLKHERTWPDLHPDLEETFRPRVRAVAATTKQRRGAG